MFEQINRFIFSQWKTVKLLTKDISKGIIRFCYRFKELWLLNLAILIAFFLIKKVGNNDFSNYFAEFLGMIFTVYILDFLYVEKDRKKEKLKTTKSIYLIVKLNKMIDDSLKSFLEHKTKVDLNNIQSYEIVDIITMDDFWRSEVQIDSILKIERTSYISFVFKKIDNKIHALEIGYPDLFSSSNMVVTVSKFEEMFYTQHFGYDFDYAKMSPFNFSVLIRYLIDINKELKCELDNIKEYLKHN